MSTQSPCDRGWDYISRIWPQCLQYHISRLNCDIWLQFFTISMIVTLI